MPNKEEKRITEQSSLYEHLEKMSVDELTAHINAENKKVAVAIDFGGENGVVALGVKNPVVVEAVATLKKAL